jgi:PAS domain S-box-containing protein
MINRGPDSNSDDTAKIHKMQISTQEQLRQLSQRVNDLIELLRVQRDILRERGMTLPSGSLDSLKMLKAQLDKMGQQLGGRLIELNQLRALATTASLINSSLDPTDVLNQVMDTVIRLTGAERGYIVLKNWQTGEMDFRVARGIDQEQLNKSDFLVSSTIVNQVASTGEPVLTDNASNEDRWKGHQSIVNFQLRSILAVPLKAREEIIGVVYCDNRIMAGLFKEHELNLLKAFANQAAVAIENARLFEDLRIQLAQMTEVRDLMNNIFTSIASGVVTVNASNIITLCNAPAERILSRKQEQVIGRSLDDVLTSLNGTFHESLERVRAAGTREVMEVHPTLDDGKPRVWNVIMSPLLDENNAWQGIALVLDDLTEIRAREAQIGSASKYLKVKIESIAEVEMLELGGVEREISVLHSDVRGFTTFSEKLDPEELMEIINKYLRMSSDAINLYDGVVDKYMGDAVTGLFNTQFNPMENHAVQAVRAAMSMMYDLFALHEVLPEEQRLFYGIGVHTGMAVLGNVGSHNRKEFSALGDATDLSKLLQENALGGEILISEATYEQVQGFYECEALEPRKTKGREDFTVMYKVLKHKKRTAPLDLDSLDF